MKKSKKIAVIGAGLAGLGMAKALKDRGYDYDQFEQKPDLGGNWRYGVYDSVHIISSKKTTQYPEFPMPESYPDFPSFQQMLAYLVSYSEKFGLKDKIQFNKEVREVKKSGDNWIIITNQGEEGPYNAVIIANGHHWDSRFPEIPGKFSGEIIHSKEYKTSDILQNKRVLIMGAGNSALDIAVEAAQFAKESHISMRRGRWIIPKTSFGIPSVDIMQPWMPKWFLHPFVKTLIKVQVGNYSDYGLPEPDDEIFERHPTVNSQFLYFAKHGKIKAHPDVKNFDNNYIIFADGSKKEFDLVIYATGFHVSFPMLSNLDFKYNKNGMPDFIYGLLPLNQKNIFVFGTGQPRYGAGPIVSAGAPLICDLIEIQDNIQNPISNVLARAGINPLEREALDPFKVLEDIARLRTIVPALPLIDKVQEVLPEFLRDRNIYNIRKNFCLPHPKLWRKEKDSKIVYMPYVRKPEFEFESAENHWMENNPFSTHFLNSLHLIFPDGEKYFIRSVNSFTKDLNNPELLEKVRAFSGQEAQHMKEHKNFWERLENQGYDIKTFLNIYNGFNYNNFEEAGTKYFGSKIHLSQTVALEHYTAVMAEVVLENNAEMLRGMPVEMKNLFQWHAAEEIEHKSVAFDVLKEVDDNYFLRMSGFALGTFNLSFYGGLGMLLLLSQEKDLNFSQFIDFVKRATPFFAGIFQRLPAYFRPDFHPEDMDNRKLAELAFKRIENQKVVNL